MPSTITYLISRAWMRRSNSCVEMPSRRAAWLTRNNSDDIGATLRVIKTKSTAEQPDLSLNVDHGDEPGQSRSEHRERPQAPPEVPETRRACMTPPAVVRHAQPSSAHGSSAVLH